VSEGLAIVDIARPDAVLEFFVVGLCTEAATAEHARARHAEGDLEAAHARGAGLLQRFYAATTVLGSSPARRVTAEIVTAEAEWSRITGPSDPNRWSEAASAWESMGFGYRAAYSHWRQAEALLASGARQEAAAVLTGGWQVCRQLGFRLLAAELESLARRARLELPIPADAANGSSDPRPEVADRFRLTRREREVLALVTDGRTNRQIAENLYISEKTASVHVSNILTKLGVANRGHAAAVAHRLGLVAGTD
jgi:DNA-binding CsgD family transcriptional regulator